MSATSQKVPHRNRFRDAAVLPQPAACWSARRRLLIVNLPFLAALTLVVYLPAKLLIQFGCYVGNVPGEGLLSYLLMESPTWR